MILDRPAALWTALVAAGLNAIVLVGGVQLSTDQLAALNGFALAAIALLSYQRDQAVRALLLGRLGGRKSQ